MEKVFENEFGTLSRDDERKISVFERSTTPADPARFQGYVEEFIAKVPAEHAGYGAVFDMRAAKGSNDPKLERVGQENMTKLAGVLARFSMLVQTEVGALQIRRVSRDAPSGPVPVTTNLERAYAFAAGELDALD